MPVRPYRGQVSSVPPPGRYELPHERPTLAELLPAAIAQENLISWALPMEGNELDLWTATPLEALVNRASVDDPMFNQFSDENLEGTIFAENPDLWGGIAYANTREQILQADMLVRQQLQRRQQLHEGGLAGWVTTVLAGVLSPETFLVPVGLGLRMTSSIGRRSMQLGLANAATAGAVETLLHQQQPIRPILDTVGAVGGSGLFGATIGGLTGLYTKALRDRIVGDIQRTMDQRGIESLLDAEGRLLIDPEDMAHFRDLQHVATELGRPVEQLQIAVGARKRRIGHALRIRDRMRSFFHSIEERPAAEKVAEEAAERVEQRMTPEDMQEAIEEHGSVGYPARPLEGLDELERVARTEVPEGGVPEPPLGGLPRRRGEPPPIPEDLEGTGPILSIGLRILQGVAAVRRLAARGEGIDTLRTSRGDPEQFGNPFTHLELSRTKALVQVGSRQEAVDAYESWLRGTAYQDVAPAQRAWIVDQIESGRLDDQTLLYYSAERPNHAEVLAQLVNERLERIRAPKELTSPEAERIGPVPEASEAVAIQPEELPARSLEDLAAPYVTPPRAAPEPEVPGEPAPRPEATVDTAAIPVHELADAFPGIGPKTVEALQRLGLETFHDVRQAILDERLRPHDVPRGTFPKVREAVFTQEERAFLDSELVDPALESPTRIQALSILRRRNPEALKRAIFPTSLTRSHMGITPAGQEALDRAIDEEATRALGRVDRSAVDYEEALAKSEAAEVAEIQAKNGPEEGPTEDRATGAIQELSQAEGRLTAMNQELRALEADQRERPRQGVWRGIQREYHMRQREMDPRHAKWLMREFELQQIRESEASKKAAAEFEAETKAMPKREPTPAPARAKLTSKVPTTDPRIAPFFAKQDGARGMRVFLMESGPPAGTVEKEGVSIHPGFLPMRQNLFGAAVVIGNTPRTGMVELALEAPFTSPELNVLTRRMVRGQRFIAKAKERGDLATVKKAEERLNELAKERRSEMFRLRRGGQQRIVLAHVSQIHAGLDDQGRAWKSPIRTLEPGVATSQSGTFERTTGIRRGIPTSTLAPEETAKASFGTVAGQHTADLISGFADRMGKETDQSAERITEIRGLLRAREKAIRTVQRKVRLGEMEEAKGQWAISQRMGEIAELEDELASLFTESSPLRFRTRDDPFLDRMTDTFSSEVRRRGSESLIPTAPERPTGIPPKTALFLEQLAEKMKSVRGMVLTGAPKEQVDASVNHIVAVARRNLPFKDPATGVPDPINEAVLLEDLADAILGNPLDSDIPGEVWQHVERGEMPQALVLWKSIRRRELQELGAGPEEIVAEMERLNDLIDDATRWYTTRDAERLRSARDIEEIAAPDPDEVLGVRATRETGDTRDRFDPRDPDLDDYEVRQTDAEGGEAATRSELEEPVEMPDDIQLMEDEGGPGAWMSPRLRAAQLQQLGIQRVHQKLAKVWGVDVDHVKRFLRWSPKLRLATSPNPQMSKFGQEIANTGLYYQKNQWGIPNLPSVEDRVRDRQGVMLQLLEEIPRAYARYYKRKNGIPTTGTEGPYEGVRYGFRQRLRKITRQNDQAIDPSEFRRAIGEALMRGDTSPIPEVQSMAQLIRGRVYAPALHEMEQLGMLPEGLDPAIAPSYLTRIYKIDAIKKDRNRFLSIAADHYVSKGVEKRKAAIMAQETLDHILGSPDGIIPWEAIDFRRTRTAEKRAFDIPDETLLQAGYLDTDIDTQLKFYFRSIIPDIELGKLHSKLTPTKPQDYRADPSLKSVLKRLRQGYLQMIQAEPDARLKRELEGRMESDLRDAESMIHELRGTLGAPRDPDSFWVRAGAAVRRNNVMLDAGTFTLSSLPDAARPVMIYGLRRVYGTMIRDMVKSWSTFKLNARDAKTFGTAGDIWTNVRAQAMGDVGDLYGRHTPFENALRIGSEYMSFLSLLAPWNTMMKQWVSGGVQQMMAEDLLGTALTGSARGSQLPQQEMVRRWARLGFGPQDLVRVTNELQQRVAAGGVNPNGVIEVASHLWRDREMALRWRVAVRRQVDQAIVTPGIGDKPIFMSGEAGRFFFQYKTFSIAATTHMMLLAGQQADRAVWNGIMLGTAVGMGSIWLKSNLYGYPTPNVDSPEGIAWWLRNGIDRTGIWGMAGNFNDFVGIATRGGLSVGRPLGGVDPGYRFTSRNVLTELVGPSASTALDYGEVAGGIGDLSQGRAPSLASSNAFKRILWMNNTIFLSRSLDRMVGGGRRTLVRALDLEPPRSARERKRPRRARAPEALLMESEANRPVAEPPAEGQR